MRSKEWAHPLFWFLRSTGPAAVTGSRGITHLGRSPKQLEFVQLRLRCHHRTQIADCQMGIIGQNLAGIQQILRIKKILDLLKNAVKLAVLRTQECRARKP